MVFNGPAAGEFELTTVKGRIAMKFGFIAFGIVAAASLLAQYGGTPMRRPHATMRQPAQQAAALQSLKTYLNLSDAQFMQLKDLSDQNRIATQPISVQIRANQVALHGSMTASTEPDPAKAGRLVIESQKLRTQLEASRRQLTEKTVALLTPEQQQKLATLSSTIQAQREASPGLMPESWPMLRAAAQLGLIAPPTRGAGEAVPADQRRGPAPAAPAQD